MSLRNLLLAVIVGMPSAFAIGHLTELVFRLAGQPDDWFIRHSAAIFATVVWTGNTVLVALVIS
jgi:hypothetical protein